MDFSILMSTCAGVFGEACTYTPATSAAVALTDAIFSHGAMDGQPDTTGPVLMEVKVPAFAVNPARGDVVTWGARNYRVLDVREDVALAAYTISLDEVR